jgi:hypothetical protein
MLRTAGAAVIGGVASARSYLRPVLGFVRTGRAGRVTVDPNAWERNGDERLRGGASSLSFRDRVPLARDVADALVLIKR